MKSNLLIRLIVAVILIPLIFFVTLKGKIPFLVFIQLLTILGMFEFCRIVKLKQANIPSLFLLLMGVAFPIFAYLWREVGILSLIVLSLTINALLVVFAGKAKNGILKTGSSIFGMTYISLGFSFFLMLRELPFWSGAIYEIGALWVIFILLAIWSCDTFAYLVGMLIGKHQLSPEISPKKTWEGAIGGFFGSIIAAPFCYFVFFKQAPLEHLFIISIIIGTFGQVGDLLESLLKRDVNIKDTSTLIPGHGGVLDRFDSLLFVSPIIYFYLKFFIYG